MRSVPNHAASEAATAVSATTFQSIKLSWRELLSVEIRAIITITAKDVATAFFCSNPNILTKAGTIKIPPPTPHRAPNNPAARPIVVAVRRVFMILQMRLTADICD